MKLNKIVLSVVLSIAALLFLSSCEKINDYMGLTWAEVDSNKIKRELEDIAKDQNKKKYIELEAKYDGAKEKRDSVRDLLSRLKDEEKDNCQNKFKSDETSKKIKTDPSVLREPSVGDTIIIGSTRSMRTLPTPLQECFDDIKRIESIKNLQDQYDEMEKMMEDKRKFDQEMSKLSEKEMKKMVENYATGKYDLVIKEDASNILYARAKIKVDITAAVLEHIKNNKPDLVVKDFVEYSEPAPAE